jgi:alkanesulfonate monooxygenase SsuD/methylene tetrahydromethanopterin reductase-like flavin-dependent oxidoreductase (luciferase family)
VHEPLVTLAFLAAHTSRLLLGTSVLITPLREPILLAKQIATLDALAPGRVLLGVGTGWEPSEFDAVGADFTTRGRRTDDILKTVRMLHTTGRGPGGGTFAPTPTHPVPIVVGGTSPRALRHAVHLVDTWQALGRTPEEFTADREHLRTLSPRPVSAGARIAWSPDRDLADLLPELHAWREADPAHLAVWVGHLATAPERITTLGKALHPMQDGAPG